MKKFIKKIVVLDVSLLFDYDVRKIIFTRNAVDSNKNKNWILLLCSSKMLTSPHEN